MTEWLEYAAVWVTLKMLGGLPRGAARGCAAMVARALYVMRPRLRRTAEFNLRLAFPEWGEARRRRVIRGLVRNFGWLAAGFARFPPFPRGDIGSLCGPEGPRQFLEAQRR